MARYLDVDKISSYIRENFSIDKTKNADICFAFIDLMNWLDDQPTADVVEVVRCRNCKHAFFQYNMKDTLQEIYACRKRPTGRAYKKVGGDFFCKHGERRDT